METAREQARQKALAGIKKAGESGDWRAWAKFLELSYPEYRRPETRVEVTATAPQQGVQIVCDEATRQALIKGREQFLREGPKSPPQPEQPKLQPGKIGATHVPGEHVPGEQPPEDKQQAVWQPGTTFTPFWEPWGVSEDDLYR